MNTYRLDDMINGWFVGAFNPTAYSTDACEVAVKKYVAGEKESAHYHEIATETTLVMSGTVRMCGKEWSAGDIIVLVPGEITTFEAVTKAVNVVVKVPGALNDKFFV
jgi:quercetin dioxygenase-like cupin family protein